MVGKLINFAGSSGSTSSSIYRYYHIIMGRLEQWMEKRSCNFCVSFSWDWLLFLALWTGYQSLYLLFKTRCSSVFSVTSYQTHGFLAHKCMPPPHIFESKQSSTKTYFTDYTSYIKSKTINTCFISTHKLHKSKTLPKSYSSFQQTYDNKKHNHLPGSQKNTWTDVDMPSLGSNPNLRGWRVEVSTIWPGTWFTKIHLEPQGQPFRNGCFYWMIPNLYIGNGCFNKHPL